MPKLTLRPNEDVSGDWTGSGAGALYAHIDEAVLDTGDYVIGSGAAGSAHVFGFATSGISANASRIDVVLHGAAGMYGGTVDVRLRVLGGSWSLAQSAFGYGGSPARLSFFGDYDQADVDSIQVEVTDVLGAAYYYPAASIHQLYVIVFIPNPPVPYGPADDEVIADAPVSFWRFNDYGNLILDEMPAERHFTGPNGWEPEQPSVFVNPGDRSIYIDAAQPSNLATATSAYAPDDWTLEWWLKPDGNPHGINHTITWGSGYLFHHLADGSGYFGEFSTRMTPGDGLPAGTMPTSGWFLVSLTFTKTGSGVGTGRFYVNGVLKNTKANMAATHLDSITIQSGSNGVKGWLENMSLYGAALSQARIQAHYDARDDEGPPSEYSEAVHDDTPRAYYQVSEPQSSTVMEDATANNRDGTYSGFVGVWHEQPGAVHDDPGFSVKLDADNNYITPHADAHAFADPGDFSVELIAKPDAANDGGNVWLFLQGGNQFIQLFDRSIAHRDSLNVIGDALNFPAIPSSRFSHVILRSSRTRSSVAPAYTPASEPNVVGWFHPESGYFDAVSGGAAVVTVGNQIFRWQNAIAGMPNFEREGGVDSGVLSANLVNGYRPIALNGRLMYYRHDLQKPFSVYLVARTITSAARVLSGIDRNWLLGWSGGSRRVAYFDGDTALFQGTGVAADTKWYLHSALSNDALGAALYSGGKLVIDGRAANAGPGGLNIGGGVAGTVSEASDCEVVEIVVADARHDPATHKRISNYLLSKYRLGSELQIWVDGVRLGAVDVGGEEFVAWSTAYVGRDGGTFEQSTLANGWVDEIAFYDGALPLPRIGYHAGLVTAFSPAHYRRAILSRRGK